MTSLSQKYKIFTMKYVLKFLIRSHLFLALASFVFFIGIQSYSELIWIYAFMISMGIIGIYNSHRLWKYNRKRLPEHMQKWTFRNKTSIYILSIIPTFSASFLYLYYFFGNPLIDFLTGLCVFVSVFYVCRLMTFSLREIPYMKVIFVILIWYLLFFVFPYLIFGITQQWLLGFLLLLIILIPSDIKDVYFDPKEMKTIPQIMGLNRSIRIIQLVILSSVLILLFRDEELSNSLPWIFGFLYFFLLTLFYKKIGYKYFFVFADFTFLLIGGVGFILFYM